MSPGGEACTTVVDGEVAVVFLGAPSGARPTLTPALLTALVRAVTDVDQSASVNVMVLTGAGRVFGLGADLGLLVRMTPSEREQYLRQGQRLTTSVGRCRCVTIAAVNGLALGGALELALACDVRWSDPRAAFAFPEYALGLTPAWGGTALVRQHVGSSLARELLAGRRIGARTAHAGGLVSQILPARSFLTDVRRQAARLARAPAETLRALKARRCAPHDVEAWLAEERRLFHARFAECPLSMAVRPAGSDSR